MLFNKTNGMYGGANLRFHHMGKEWKDLVFHIFFTVNLYNIQPNYLVV